MGVDPVSLALLGSAIFGATQQQRSPKPKVLPPPAEKISQTDQAGTTRRRRRGSMFGQAQDIIDEPLG